MERMSYTTGLTDRQWSWIEPLVTGWKQARVARLATGNPGSCDLREAVNALLHQNRTGCQWRLLPHDFPAWSAVCRSTGQSAQPRTRERAQCAARPGPRPEQECCT
ncbi:transposase, partial [Streptomyces sp. NPDC019224]|uniref:transposase n=1 Tax=Streptomyces sp. NPDC019224 TaxID=3154484 RepID=UPI00340F13FC